MTKRVGIFGGSFNPIHVGHAIIASAIMRRQLVDQLWFMVTPENPFKSGQNLASEVHRLRMTELVSRRIEGASTSAFEMQLPRPSYTIDTLHALSEKFPDIDFYLIIGADNWAQWNNWKSPQEIVSNYHVLIYPRLGFEVNIPPAVQHQVQLIDAPIIEVSSTHIRQLLTAGQPATFLLPDPVATYITTHKLYSTHDITIEP
ncbi:MAG: nicotinate-nucleotide adenylyltransferase [Muribaculaceae bacterium]|nr:nicotinate-nucleotide adenylyltransferase [Muribaculaceae bacterium]